MNKLIFVAVILLLIAAPFAVTAEAKENKKPVEDVDYKCVAAPSVKETPPAPPGTTFINGNSLCKEGKVPKNIAVYERKDKKRIPSDVAPSPTWYYGAWYDYASITKFSPGTSWMFGAERMSQNASAPSITPYTYHSLAELAMYNTRGDVIEVGWTKHNSSSTHIFSYIWINGLYTCYVGDPGCNNGYIQLGTQHYPGMPVDSNENVSIFLMMYNTPDDPEMNWWVWYGGEWMGYYPQSIWGGAFQNATTQQAFGEIASMAAQTYSDMGNGMWGNDTQPDLRFGDVTMDGNTTLLDVQWMQEVLVGLRTFNTTQTWLGDVNPTPNGRIDSGDVTIVNRSIHGIPTPGSRVGTIAVKHEPMYFQYLWSNNSRMSSGSLYVTSPTMYGGLYNYRLNKFQFGGPGIG